MARQVGRTADGVAVSRAAHFFQEGGRVFSDPCAVDLIAPWLRPLVRHGWLYRLTIGRHREALRPVVLGSFACARITEEWLEEAMARGIAQLVLLGAGLDSFALRRSDLAGRLRVFEIDHPATQALKRARISRSRHALPPNLVFVPLDFERETLEEGLGRCDFDFEAPAFFSWLGTVPYLTESAVFQTLDAIARACAVGSEVVLNYTAPRSHLQPEDVAILEELARRVRRRGEPFRSSFDPDAFPQRVAQQGYEIVSQLSAAELDAWCLAPLGEATHTLSTGRLLYARTKR